MVIRIQMQNVNLFSRLSLHSPDKKRGYETGKKTLVHQAPLLNYCRITIAHFDSFAYSTFRECDKFFGFGVRWQAVFRATPL
jgi:hypothetical protein